MAGGRVAALAAMLAATGACADVRLRVIDARPSRPAGCAVDLFPGEKGPLWGEAHADVAYAEVTCRRRERCVDELRRQACAVGARGVYWSWEETRDGQTEIDAHFAVAVPTPSDSQFWPKHGCVRPLSGRGRPYTALGR